MLVDVHTHLTHAKFAGDESAVVQRAEQAGLKAVIVNGLEPKSNRRILEMAQQWPIVQAAVGIYPVDAVNNLLPDDFQIPVAKFDVDAEVNWIREQAAAGRLIAIGECGLDGHWPDPNTFARQEAVFRELITIAQDHELPLIIHTRKMEQRSAEILREMKVERVNFHCFGGRTKWAQAWAEQDGWYFSIPANSRKNQAFAKMLGNLPPERILTETDAPYLGPERGERNEPANVAGTVEHLAEIRSWSLEEAQQTVWQNYQRLFKPEAT